MCDLPLSSWVQSTTVAGRRRALRSPPAAAPRALAAGAFAALALTGLAAPAHAYCPSQAPDPSNDLSLECLIGKRQAGESASPTLREMSNYRSLLSELSAVMAVPVLAPADTVGYTGFHFSLDTTVTSISRNAEFWSGVPDNGERTGAGVRRATADFLPVLSVMLRKGMWLPLPPLPSVELGIGASNLLYSGIYGINGSLKLAVHEGYHQQWGKWVPSFALRGAASRIAGASQVDLTILSGDALVSKAFGVGGTVTLQPYLGGGVQFSIVRSQVIDTAPTEDLYRGPAPPAPPLTDAQRVAALDRKIIFPTQDNIFRWRAFAGIEADYAILAVNASFAYFGAGADSGFDLSTLPTPAMAQNSAPGAAAACRVGPNGTVCPKDVAAAQYQIAVGLGLRF